MKPLVVVTGPDGAGKSSVCARISEMMGESVSIVDVWQGIQQSPFRACRDRVHEYMKDLDARSRALLILHTLSRSMQKAFEGRATLVVADGYWYKYAVTELALSGDETIFSLAKLLFAVPHSTYFLDVTPANAALRKSSFSGYESGFSDDNKLNAFMRFQTRIYDKWQTLKVRYPDWRVIDTASHSVENSASVICSEISKI